jgi:lipoprotein-releasing system permease protein
VTSFPWFVARRYLTARRRQAFISVISGVSIAGVGVGVMALVIALALMTGVQQELQNRIVGSAAHVYVNRLEGPFDNVEEARRMLRIPGVVGVAPAVEGFGLLTVSGVTPSTVTIKGIDPALEPEVTDLASAMVTGRASDLVNRPPDAHDGILLGVDLAADLGVRQGDIVDLITPELTSTVYGMRQNRRPLEVLGTFRFGFYQVDASWALVSLKTGLEMFNKTAPDMMQLKLTDLNQAPVIRARLQQQLGAAYDVKDWTMLNGPLYSALWLEKIAISLTIGLIVMVAALNIVASLVLLVMEKNRDIAILRTMGAPARIIRRIFIYQGLTIGLLGTTVGVVLGLIVCFVADRYRLVRLPADVYQIPYLPFRVQPLDVTIVVLAVMAVCLLATLYPSRQAARLDPAEALRHQ